MCEALGTCWEPHHPRPPAVVGRVLLSRFTAASTAEVRGENPGRLGLRGSRISGGKKLALPRSREIPERLRRREPRFLEHARVPAVA